MAGDWIKMRTDLYRDPKICVIADLLLDADGDLARYVSQNCRRDMTVTRNVMRNVTVGALVTLWGVTRHRGKRNGDDLLVRHATVTVCDDIADLPGLGAAMESVGWVIQTNEGVVFPRFFEEFNVDPADDAKVKAAERQRRYRQKRNVTRDVTTTSQSNAREEKRREEKSNKKTNNGDPARSPFLEDPQFGEAFDSFCESSRVNHNWTIAESTKEAWLMQLYDLGLPEAVKALQFSTAAGAKKPIINGDHNRQARQQRPAGGYETGAEKYARIRLK